jgi:membrane protein
MRREESVGFGKELVEQFQADDASGMAAELAYRWLFALFPFGLFLAALGAFVAAAMGIQNPAQQIVDGVGDNLPEGLASSIQPELERVINQQQPGIASIGALAALWAATSGTMTVIKAMNRAYGVEETRGAVRKYATGIGLTVGGAAGLLLSFVTIVGGALLTEEIASQLGVGATAWAVINILRWPLVFVLLVVAVSVMLRVGPNMTPTWRSSLIGGAIFASGWLAATLLLALYVSNFADYGATYGALAGVIVMMLWLYVTAIVLILAGEVVALITKRNEPERLSARQEETRASKGVGAVVSKIGLQAGTAPSTKGGDEDATDRPADRKPKAGSGRAARPARNSMARAAYRPRKVPQAPRERQPNEVPARVVAAVSAIVALIVGFLTSRISRR